ncbi:MAG: sulfite exporter TauE/SafE family protein [Calditrichaeota bacterium]|nr:sulfite exporter TauE/SafE family protein [Calditrichota bacterium]
MNYILIFFISIFTSAASALVGLGGGVLLIPFLILIFDLPIKYVAGTMLLAMVPYTAVATWGNVINEFVNFRIGIVMETGAVAGVLIGALFTGIFPDFLLKIIFLLIVFYLMLTLKIPTNSPYNYIAKGFKKINFIPPFITCKTANGARCSIPSLIFLGIIAGFFSGLLGIGGGFLNTPVLIVGVLLPAKVAVGTSIFMILITSIFGAVEHAYLNHVDYLLAAIIAAGMVIGAFTGTYILRNIEEHKIKNFLFVVMFIAAIMTLFR